MLHSIEQHLLERVFLYLHFAARLRCTEVSRRWLSTLQAMTLPLDELGFLAQFPASKTIATQPNLPVANLSSAMLGLEVTENRLDMVDSLEFPLAEHQAVVDGIRQVPRSLRSRVVFTYPRVMELDAQWTFLPSLDDVLLAVDCSGAEVHTLQMRRFGTRGPLVACLPVRRGSVQGWSPLIVTNLSYWPLVLRALDCAGHPVAQRLTLTLSVVSCELLIDSWRQDPRWNEHCVGYPVSF